MNKIVFGFFGIMSLVIACQPVEQTSNGGSSSGGSYNPNNYGNSSSSSGNANGGDAGSDAGAENDSSDAGTDAQISLAFGENCNDDSECTTNICYHSSSGESYCSVSCSPNDECQTVHNGICTNRGICRIR